MNIRRHLVATLAATALTVAGIAVVSTSVSAQTATPVQQGQTVSLGAIDPFLDNFTVDPAAAGTVVKDLVVDPLSAGLRFTASSSFTGPATIRQSDGTAAFTVLVVGPSADVGATFTPRPAPGPCIQIVSGATVAFGDVTVGATATAATGTVVSNCSSGLDVDLFGSITQATSGTGQGAVVWEPVQTPPTPNQFRYRLQNSGDNVDRVLDSDSSVFVQRLPNSFTRTFDHTLTIGAGSTTGLNSQFNATITLLAAVA